MKFASYLVMFILLVSAIGMPVSAYFAWGAWTAAFIACAMVVGSSIIAPAYTHLSKIADSSSVIAGYCAYQGLADNLQGQLDDCVSSILKAATAQGFKKDDVQ